MNINDTKKLKVGDVLWCVVGDEVKLAVYKDWVKYGLPKEFIFLKAATVSFDQLQVASKDDGKMHILKINRCELTATAAIQNAINSLQASIRVIVDQRKRFESMLEEE